MNAISYDAPLSEPKKHRDPQRTLVSRQEFNDLLLEVVHDREMCREAGALYWRMNHEDIEALRAYLREQYQVAVPQDLDLGLS